MSDYIWLARKTGLSTRTFFTYAEKYGCMYIWGSFVMHFLTMSSLWWQLLHFSQTFHLKIQQFKVQLSLSTNWWPFRKLTKNRFWFGGRECTGGTVCNCRVSRVFHKLFLFYLKMIYCTSVEFTKTFTIGYII